MQITTVLTRAAPRLVTPRNGSQPFTVYEVFDHENTAWRVKEDVYNATLPFIGIGQPVEMVVRVEQNGQWTNRFADIITPSANAAVPASNAAQQAMAAAQAAQQITPAQVAHVTGISPYVPGELSEKDKQIHRQVAAKVAGGISNNASEFWQNCQDLAFYFDTGHVPSDNQPPALAGAASGYQHGDEDIPF